jgi:hypothetical protein
MRTSLLEILRGGVRLRNDGSEEGGEMDKLSLRPLLPVINIMSRDNPEIP